MSRFEEREKNYNPEQLSEIERINFELKTEEESNKDISASAKNNKRKLEKPKNISLTPEGSPSNEKECSPQTSQELNFLSSKSEIKETYTPQKKIKSAKQQFFFLQFKEKPMDQEKIQPNKKQFIEELGNKSELTRKLKYGTINKKTISQQSEYFDYWKEKQEQKEERAENHKNVYQFFQSLSEQKGEKEAERIMHLAYELKGEEGIEEVLKCAKLFSVENK